MKHALDTLTAEAQKELWAALALRHCELINPRLMKTLCARFGSAYAVFCHATNKEFLRASEGKPLIPPAVALALRQEKWRIAAHHEWRLIKSFYGEIILWTDYRYPLGLKQIIDAPAFFYVQGDSSLLASPSVAIVGSRKYHPLTVEKTYTIARDLSASGICVISGMAKGIDFAAHSGALMEIGKTIAVLGTGADIVYPSYHKKLYDEIIENGLILSEFAPQTKPLPHHFPIRNRLVSGLSEAILVAEAAPKSGSLITARLALEQNRNVYVLSPVHENHSLGGHALIQDGATLIDDALGIIVDIAPYLNEKIELNDNTEERDKFDIEEHLALEDTPHTPADLSMSADLSAPNTPNTPDMLGVLNTSNAPNTLDMPNTLCVLNTSNDLTEDSSFTEKRNTSQKNTPTINNEGLCTEDTNAEYTDTEYKNTGEPDTEEPENDEPDTDEPDTDEPVIQDTKIKKVNPKKGSVKTPLPSREPAPLVIYASEATKERPCLHEDLSFLDVDFARLAESIIGESASCDNSAILALSVKKKAKNSQKSKKVLADAHNNMKEKNISLAPDSSRSSESFTSPDQSTSSTHPSTHEKNPVEEVKKDRTGLSDLEKSILEVLDKKSMLAPDEILLLLPEAMQDISSLSMSLLMLEVEAYLVRVSGNRYKLF